MLSDVVAIVIAMISIQVLRHFNVIWIVLHIPIHTTETTGHIERR